MREKLVKKIKVILNPIGEFFKGIKVGWYSHSYFNPHENAEQRIMRWNRNSGCTCKDRAETAEWYGPYCPVHRPWPQEKRTKVASLNVDKPVKITLK